MKKLWPRVLRWAKDGGPVSAAAQEEMVNQLTALIEGYPGRDGFELAKILERKGWCGVDAFLVDILDDVYACELALRGSLVNDWVREWNVVPPHRVGQEVLIKHELKSVKGVITKIHESNASYTVTCESLGHSLESGRLGLIVPFEDVKIVEEQRV
jgi:hypothetical protein